MNTRVYQKKLGGGVFRRDGEGALERILAELVFKLAFIWQSHVLVGGWSFLSVEEHGLPLVTTRHERQQDVPRRLSSHGCYKCMERNWSLVHSSIRGFLFVFSRVQLARPVFCPALLTMFTVFKEG